MSSIKLKHSGGNSVILAAPSSNPAADRTLTVPSNADGTILTTTSPKSGNILQVVSAYKKGVFSSTSNSFTAITDLSASITPSSASNKILVRVCLGTVATTGNQYAHFIRLYKDGSHLSDASAPTSSNRTSCFMGGRTTNTNHSQGYSGEYLDTAGGTSSITYAVYWTGEAGFGTIYLNSEQNNPDGNAYCLNISTITLMEVAA